MQQVNVRALAVLLFLIWSIPDGAVAPNTIGSRLDLPSDGFKVLIVRETAPEDGWEPSPSQAQAMFSAKLRGDIRSRGGEFALLDQNTVMDHEPNEWFRKAMKLPRTRIPWLVASNGSKAISKPLPEVGAVEEIMSLAPSKK